MLVTVRCRLYGVCGSPHSHYETLLSSNLEIQLSVLPPVAPICISRSLPTALLSPPPRSREVEVSDVSVCPCTLGAETRVCRTPSESAARARSSAVCAPPEQAWSKVRADRCKCNVSRPRAVESPFNARRQATLFLRGKLPAVRAKTVLLLPRLRLLVAVQE